MRMRSRSGGPMLAIVHTVSAIIVFVQRDGAKLRPVKFPQDLRHARWLDLTLIVSIDDNEINRNPFKFGFITHCLGNILAHAACSCLAGARR